MTTLERSASKRKRDGGHKRSASKRVNTSRTQQSDTEIQSINENDLAIDRIILLKIFNALEACLLSTLSLSSFHSVQTSVTNAARHTFTLDHLAQLLGVWPDAYLLEPTMAFYEGTRTPSLSILVRQHDMPTGAGHDRRQEFEVRLASWFGQKVPLPTMQQTTLIPLNAAKIASMQRVPVAVSRSIPDDTLSPVDRQAALRERLQQKAIERAAEPTTQERNDATVAALIPNAIRSIKILLASRQTKSMTLGELIDNLVTSMNNRVGREEVQKMIDVMSKSVEYGHWCKVGHVGGVTLVRFIGRGP